MKTFLTISISLLIIYQAIGQSKIQISKTLEDSQMKEILSASGIEMVNDKTYIVSDNQNVLFVKTNSGIKSIALRKTDHTNFVAKTNKKDFESICHYQTESQNYLLIISSGSLLNTRDSIFIFDITKEQLAYVKNVRELYNNVQKRMGLETGQLINIEASTTTKNKILLFHRGNESKQNYMLSFDKKEFVNYLTSNTNTPDFLLTAINLPIKKELAKIVNPGVSGAYTINDNEIMITYSMERTNSNYNDGEILGSYLGVLNLENNKVVSVPFNSKENKSELRKIKIEGVAIHKQEKNTYQISVVSDNDNGVSDFINLNILYY